MNGSSREGWVGDWWATFVLGTPKLPAIETAPLARLRWYNVVFQGDTIGQVVRWSSGRGIWRISEGDWLSREEYGSRQEAAAVLFERWVGAQR
jgi:hypothetical protein